MKSTKLLEGTCRNCGQLFNYYQSITAGIYCSKKCEFEYRHKQRTQKACLVCGKVFFVAPHEKEARRYCSIKCHHIALRKGEFKKCPICGKLFWVVQHKENTKKYCSRKCSSIMLRERMSGEGNPNYRDGRCALPPGKRIVSKAYRKGKDKERQARHILESLGYWVVRSGGSHGTFDLYAFNQREIRMIQVKANKEPKSEEKQEIKDFDNHPPNASKEVWVFIDGKPKEPQITKYE